MATNISPLDWTLIPPEASSPNFGYQISGPVGQSGFLRMFIPASMFSYISTLVGQTVTPNDMAVFSGTTQTNVLVEDQGNGSALVKVSVPFSSTNTEVTEVVEATVQAVSQDVEGMASSVAKKITVGREADISLSPNPTGKIKVNKKVQLFGCVASRVPFTVGEKVSLAVTLKGSRTPLSVRGTLDAKGCYRKPYKVVKAGTVQAILKANSSVGRASTLKSKKLSIKVG
jgi:hypothetical protein